jgi:hypothetical protein
MRFKKDIPTTSFPLYANFRVLSKLFDVIGSKYIGPFMRTLLTLKSIFED